MQPDGLHHFVDYWTIEGKGITIPQRSPFCEQFLNTILRSRACTLNGRGSVKRTEWGNL